MGERKGQQKYYPPDWRPEHGSLDSYYGTHPLRDRARKLDRGILIIRFEMPFNIWCNGCNNHIGMGVRYNAEKTKVGMYYSTPIYKFSMKCVYCPSIIEMQTDPKNCDYTVLNGGRRQNNRWKAEDAEQIEAVEYNEKQRLRNDAMFKLEYTEKDKTKTAKQAPNLAEIYHTQDARWKDCYTANSVLRKKFREEKKLITAVEKSNEEIVDRLNLNFDLVPETNSDKIEAKETFLSIPKFKEDSKTNVKGMINKEASLKKLSSLKGIKLSKNGGAILKSLKKVTNFNFKIKTKSIVANGTKTKRNELQVRGCSSDQLDNLVVVKKTHSFPYVSCSSTEVKIEPDKEVIDQNGDKDANNCPCVRSECNNEAAMTTNELQQKHINSSQCTVMSMSSNNTSLLSLATNYSADSEEETKHDSDSIT